MKYSKSFFIFSLFILLSLLFSFNTSNAQESKSISQDIYDKYSIENNSNFTIISYILLIFLALPLILVSIRLVTGAKRRTTLGLIIILFGYGFVFNVKPLTDSITNDIIGFLLLVVAIIILVTGRKKKSPQWKVYRGERRPFAAEVRLRVLKHQKNKCANCDIKIYRPLIHFDHINGNRSNNRLVNCQALCPNCHALKTDKDRRRQ